MGKAWGTDVADVLDKHDCPRNQFDVRDARSGRHRDSLAGESIDASRAAASAIPGLTCSAGPLSHAMSWLAHRSRKDASALSNA